MGCGGKGRVVRVVFRLCRVKFCGSCLGSVAGANAHGVSVLRYPRADVEVPFDCCCAGELDIAWAGGSAVVGVVLW